MKKEDVEDAIRAAMNSTLSMNSTAIESAVEKAVASGYNDMMQERKARWNEKSVKTVEKWENLANKLTKKMKAKSEEMRAKWDKKENKEKVDKVIGDAKKWYRKEVKDSKWGKKAEKDLEKLRDAVKNNEMAEKVSDWIGGWF